MLFNNPQNALDKVNQKILDLDAGLRDLAAKRAALVASLDDDNVSAIQVLDKAAQAEQAARVILVDKAAALQEECRRAEFRAREATRQTAIGTIKKKLEARLRIAAELEAAIKLMGEKYKELTAAPSVIADWPFAVVRELTHLDHRQVNREVSWALYSASAPVGGKPSLPPRSDSA